MCTSFVTNEKFIELEIKCYHIWSKTTEENYVLVIIEIGSSLFSMCVCVCILRLLNWFRCKSVIRYVCLTFVTSADYHRMKKMKKRWDLQFAYYIFPNYLAFYFSVYVSYRCFSTFASSVSLLIVSSASNSTSHTTSHTTLYSTSHSTSQSWIFYRFIRVFINID